MLTEPLDFRSDLAALRKYIEARAGDEEVAAVFGETLRSILSDAWGRGAFAALPLVEDCQLDLEEFDGMYGWPAQDDMGKTNVLRTMKGERLES